MSALTVRSWSSLLILLLASGLLAGCLPTDEELESYFKPLARDVVTKLEIDVVAEEHSVLSAIRHDMPSSWVISRYVISDAPEEVREKLKAFHDAHDYWLAPSQDGWSRDVKLEFLEHLDGPETPAHVEKYLERFPGLKDDSGIDFFIICPWYVVGAETYSTLYSDSVILTEGGALIIHLHNRAQERCHDENREQ